MFLVRAAQFDRLPIPLEKSQFAQLPLRIGRNPLNDVQLNHSLVSAFHARVEDINGRLCLRDLGSRNGVFVATSDNAPPIRVNPDEPVDLSPYGFQFMISPVIRLHVQFAEADPLLRSSRGLGQVLGNRSMLGEVVSPWLPSTVPMRATPAPFGAPPTGAASAWPGPPPARPSADPHYPTSPVPHAARASTQFFNLGLDAMALQGLRELAESLVPGTPLETTGDLARFITKLHDTVDVFCRAFVPLRDGYAEFASSLDLRQAASQRSLNRSPASAALETATTPAAVAMALLNSRDATFDAPTAVEGILADLMLHQVALLDGVMQGVKALMDELAPESIDAALAERQQSKLWGANKARWEEYRERFERLADEKQAFSLIFGRNFAEAYRQYWQQQSITGGDQRLRNERPRG